MSDAKHDSEMGMNRPITRRDFLNGFSIAVGSSVALPGAVWSEVFGLPGPPTDPEKDPAYYPPAKTGLRGSHDGSWEVAHSMRDGQHWPAAAPDSESYDVVIVGAGISGLAAAHFYRKQAGPKAKILILDNHDDFGGHAKRNEFQPGGRLLIGYGGTQSIASPNLYSAEAKRLFTELGIKVDRFSKYFDRKFYASRGLKSAIFSTRKPSAPTNSSAALASPRGRSSPPGRLFHRKRKRISHACSRKRSIICPARRPPRKRHISRVPVIRIFC